MIWLCLLANWNGMQPSLSIWAVHLFSFLMGFFYLWWKKTYSCLGWDQILFRKSLASWWWWLLQPHEKMNGYVVLFSTPRNTWECVHAMTISTTPAEHRDFWIKVKLSTSIQAPHGACWSSMEPSRTTRSASEAGKLTFSEPSCFSDCSENSPRVTCLNLSRAVFLLHGSNLDSSK